MARQQTVFEDSPPKNKSTSEALEIKEELSQKTQSKTKKITEESPKKIKINQEKNLKNKTFKKNHKEDKKGGVGYSAEKYNKINSKTNNKEIKDKNNNSKKEDQKAIPKTTPQQEIKGKYREKKQESIAYEMPKQIFKQQGQYKHSSYKHKQDNVEKRPYSKNKQGGFNENLKPTVKNHSQKKLDNNRVPKQRKKQPRKRKRQSEEAIEKFKLSHSIPVQELAKQHNIHCLIAAKLYKNEITLEQALQAEQERLNLFAKVQKLIAQYPEINVSLGYHIVRQFSTMEEYWAHKKEVEKRKEEKDLLKKIKMQKDAMQNKAFLWLEECIKSKEQIQLALYGKKEFLYGVLQDFTPYVFKLVVPKGIQKIHRLSMKYFYFKKDEEFIKKWILIDKTIKAKKLHAERDKNKRFQFPENILVEGNEIMLGLHGGEMIRGKVLWFTPYDILLQTSKTIIWIFRHAIIECAIIRKAKK
ncbi:MAG TPA: hypothetical protein P5543_00130 [Planctomycetota bacterium]|nr:hypothetical protein [Planctomycetota bacterium]HRU50590.1 hypothetical protein [Planctomycetota bacterium]